MASILRVDTLTDASSNNSTAMSTINQGTAKAWFHIPADGASILDSFNISSHDDDGTGDGGIHISSDMGSANYSVNLDCDDGGFSTSVGNNTLTQGTQAAGTFDYESVYVNASENRGNHDLVRYGTVHGDLA